MKSDFLFFISFRLFGILMNAVGLMAISFLVGSLTSILSSLDIRQAELRDKFNVLDKIKRENEDLDDDLYIRLRKTLRYEYLKEDKITFLKDLPEKLKEEFSYIIHKEKVSCFPYFRNKPKHFITYIAEKLRPIKLIKGSSIYEEGDPCDKIYFLVKGAAAFVLKEYDDTPYLTLQEGNFLWFFNKTFKVISLGNLICCLQMKVGHLFEDLQQKC